ncbi:hypothetical protein D3C81_687630 [compost metagenome]
MTSGLYTYRSARLPPLESSIPMAVISPASFNSARNLLTVGKLTPNFPLSSAFVALPMASKVERMPLRITCFISLGVAGSSFMGHLLPLFKQL